MLALECFDFPSVLAEFNINTFQFCSPLSRNVVHSQPESSPEGDHNREHAEPNGDDGDDDEGGCRDSSHNVGPHT